MKRRVMKGISFVAVISVLMVGALSFLWKGASDDTRSTRSMKGPSQVSFEGKAHAKAFIEAAVEAPSLLPSLDAQSHPSHVANDARVNREDPRVVAALAACRPFQATKVFNATEHIRERLVAYCAVAEPTDTIDLVIRCSHAEVVETLKSMYTMLSKAKGPHTLAGRVHCHEILPLLQAPLEGIIGFYVKGQPRLYNNAATSPRFLGTSNDHGLGAYGLDGRGEIVSVLDTGISSGNAASNFHVDLRPALYGMVAEPSASRSTAIDLNGHGTHVCGSVVSQGTVNAKTRAGATGAALFAQGFYDEDSKGPNLLWDTGLHFERARLVGAKILSNSWGSTTLYDFCSYGLEAQMIDAFVWNNPEAFVCFAAGNDGKDADNDGRSDACTIRSLECYAKNTLIVGAQESYRPDDQWTNNDLYEGALKHTTLANDFLARPYDGKNDGMALFSSRGPLTDGRIAPMLVAPGTRIVSTGRGSYAATVTLNGTSMATPHVAASAALFRQYLRESQQLPRPTAALMRAGLILCTESLYPGQYGTTNPEVPNESPNNVEGWGALRLGKYLAGIQKDGTQVTPQTLGFQDRITLNRASETKTFTFTTNAIGEVRVVLSWIDYYDTHDIYGNEPLCNDYDLTVRAPNGTIYTVNDHLNPIERICIPDAPVGTYTVTVSATRIAQTGTGNIAAIAWRATTATPAPDVTAPRAVSDETCTLTVKLPAGTSAYETYPVWPAPGKHAFARGESVAPFAGPRLAMSYDMWGDENGHTLSHLAGWILFDAEGRVVRQHFPSFETVVAQPYDHGMYPGYESRLSQTLHGLAQPPEKPILLEGEAYTLQWYERFPGYGIRLK